MRAIVVDGQDLVWREVETPEPRPGEVRIRVRATAVNRADLLQRRGLYPPPPGASEVLGLECAGTIDAVGPDVDRWRPGDPVCALLAGGGYAERVVCPAAQVLPIPNGVALADAAALPEVFATAWMVLVDEGRLRPGERVLVHAGASGVGTAALQLAAGLGARCFATAGGAAKLATCAELGAEGAHDRHAGPWRPAVEAWAPGGVDVVLEPVGGPYLADDQRVLAIGGRIVVIGLMGGRTAELDLGRLLVKRQRVIGTVLRSRPLEDRARIVAGVERDAWPLIASGRARPIVCARFPIARAAAAHSLVESNATVGKVILDVAAG